MQRLALAALWALGAVVVGTIAFLMWSFRQSPMPAIRQAVAEAEAIPKVRRSPDPWARWTVTEQISAVHMLVLQIETSHLDEAMAIARQVADPIKDRYAEVLIYFHRPGRPDTLPPKRIQWTRAEGWVEVDYRAEPAPPPR
jgi:hypothetical protein